MCSGYVKTDKYTTLHVGDVVLCVYSNFNNEKEVGLFAVIYDNSLDENTPHKDNFMGCKITSQNQWQYPYYVNVHKGDGNLDCDSKIACSLLHMLHKKSMLRLIGHLSKRKIQEMRKKLQKFEKDVDKMFEEVV